RRSQLIGAYATNFQFFVMAGLYVVRRAPSSAEELCATSVEPLRRLPLPWPEPSPLLQHSLTPMLRKTTWHWGTPTLLESAPGSTSRTAGIASAVPRHIPSCGLTRTTSATSASSRAPEQ